MSGAAAGRTTRPVLLQLKQEANLALQLDVIRCTLSKIKRYLFIEIFPDELDSIEISVGHHGQCIDWGETSFLAEHDDVEFSSRKINVVFVTVD